MGEGQPSAAAAVEEVRVGENGHQPKERLHRRRAAADTACQALAQRRQPHAEEEGEARGSFLPSARNAVVPGRARAIRVGVGRELTQDGNAEVAADRLAETGPALGRGIAPLSNHSPRGLPTARRRW